VGLEAQVVAALHVAEDKFGIKPDANSVIMLVKRADGKPLGFVKVAKPEPKPMEKK